MVRHDLMTGSVPIGLTTSAVARRLGVSPDRIRQMRREGVIRSVPTGLGHLFDPGDVERLAAERTRARQDGGTDAS